MSTTPIPVRTRAAMLARSFAVQGSYNYRTLLGTGFAFVVLPALRHAHGRNGADLDAAVLRHEEPFNAHPYLVGIAAGAVARLEQEGAPATVIERFKGALRGPLGALGDVLFWAGLRPACLLFALLLLGLGASPWVAVAAFLLPYNAGHVATRVWAFRLGLRHGAGVAAGLRNAPLAGFGVAARRSGAFLLGAVLPLLAGGAFTGMRIPTVAALVAAATAVGVARGAVSRVPAVIGLVLLLLFGLLRGLWS